MNQIQQRGVQTFCTKLEQYIASGIALRDAMKQVVPLYNRADVETQHEMRNKVVVVIGKIKGVQPIVLPKGIYKGALGFDKSTVKGNQARVMLQYYFPTSSTTSSTTSKQKDVVMQKSKAIKSWGMTKAQVLKAVEIAFAK